MATIPNKPKTSPKATAKAGFIGTALRMKQEADMAIKRGEVARLKQQGYTLLSFDV
ncbi:MAG: hypothetical protein ACRYFX_23750 [Janthinobacterium lividum]